jgi:hypothetical protein
MAPSLYADRLHCRHGIGARRAGWASLGVNAFAALPPSGSFSVVLDSNIFSLLSSTHRHIAVLLCIATFLLFMMKPEPALKVIFATAQGIPFVLHPNVLSGARKQLFITFAPWVLVSVLGQSTAIMATLFTIGGVIGILFQPLLGWAIDKLGERIVLASEAVVLVFVCFGYGFAKFIFPEDTAFLVVCACFLIDQMIFSVSMARSTYMKKIALQPVYPTR